LQRFENLRSVVAINSEIVQNPSFRRDFALGNPLSLNQQLAHRR
jgi:hypothetical protein